MAIDLKNHIISEEVVRTRVPAALKKLIKDEVMRRGPGTSESDILREIICQHFGVPVPPHPWKKE